MTDDATRETPIMSVGRPEDDPATVNYLEVVRLRALLAEERATSEGLRAALREHVMLIDDVGGECRLCCRCWEGEIEMHAENCALAAS